MKCLLLAIAILLACPVADFAQDTPKPATAQQIKDAIDWTKVPKLEGATKQQTHFSQLSYQAPGTFRQAADFYARELGSLGWQVDTTLPNDGQKDYLGLMVEKNGMILGVSGYRSKPEDPMSITLMIYGNVDVRQFPKAADAEVKSNYKNAVYYHSKQSPEELSSFCKKFMIERGWKEKPNPSAETWAKEGRYVLTFLQNAMEATIVTAKRKEGGAEVTYSALVQFELSAEDVVSAVSGKDQAKPATYEEAINAINLMKLPRMEHAVKGKHDKELLAVPMGTAYEVPESIDDACKFYRKLLKEQGWTELSPEIEIEQLASLKFEKAGFLLGFSASREKKEANTSVSLRNYGNVDLRKLPFPPGATIDSNRHEHINTETTLGVDEACEFYRKELSKLGWKESKERGKGILRFTQNAITLNIEIQLDVNKKTVIGLNTSMK